MKGVILDADSLGHDIDLSPITSTLDTWDIHPFTDAPNILARVRDANVVLTNKVVLDETTMLEASGLKLVSVMATGTNNIDLGAATKSSICVSNATAYATPSVVQHTIGLMLALATNLTNYLSDVRQGRWQESKVFCLLDHPIVELAGKTLGVVGYGELGSNVARVAEALGMKILIAARAGAQPTGKRVDISILLQSSDFVSLHCPLNDANHHMINAATLQLMRPSAFLINTARGALVNTEDLLAALRIGVIAGAAIDVLATEPASGDEPLTHANLPNLLVTPHNAWGAIETRMRLVMQMRENIEAFLIGEPVRRVA